mmetsp:Transcript_8192/g.25288  ORF Transcript_8192/g.25288 Transcript_8192/m.25288 type:complete len:258 (+) Transcript_8192:66-839(+)
MWVFARGRKRREEEERSAEAEAMANLTRQTFDAAAEYEDVDVLEHEETASTSGTPATFSEDNVCFIDDEEEDGCTAWGDVKTVDLSVAETGKKERRSFATSVFCAIVGDDNPRLPLEEPRGCVGPTAFRTHFNNDFLNDFAKARQREGGLDDPESPTARSPTSRAMPDFRRRSLSPVRSPRPALQDYASATVQKDEFFQAESRLHAWLILHGLGHHWHSICALGAKKIADLALLTPEDMDDLGLSTVDRQKLNIRIN